MGFALLVNFLTLLENFTAKPQIKNVIEKIIGNRSLATDSAIMS